MSSPTNTPDPIEPVHYSAPRAVQVRTPGDLSNVHSAVHGDLNVYVDSLSDAQKLIDAWPEIIQVSALKALEILGRE